VFRARWALQGSVRLAQSACGLIRTAHCTHIFAALVLLRKPLYGLQKRRIQPERYAQFFLKFFAKNNITY
jgi:hypothetical protein